VVFDGGRTGLALACPARSPDFLEKTLNQIRHTCGIGLALPGLDLPMRIWSSTRARVAAVRCAAIITAVGLYSSSGIAAAARSGSQDGSAPPATASNLVRPKGSTLKGHASDGVKRPYNRYVVVVRDVQTGAVIAKQPLDVEGNFSIDDLSSRKYVVIELQNIQQGGVVWTGGPYVLASDRPMNLAVSVGGAPQAAPWVLTAAAQVPSVVPLAIMSGSR